MGGSKREKEKDAGRERIESDKREGEEGEKEG